jgi:hypothetical protein
MNGWIATTTVKTWGRGRDLVGDGGRDALS